MFLWIKHKQMDNNRATDQIRRSSCCVRFIKVKMEPKSKEAELKNLEEDYKKTIPGNNARTSDHYNVENIPSRFDNPDLLHSLGNPIFSCSTKVEATVPTIGEEKDIFKGYAEKQPHPLYTTSSMEYGNRKPTVHVMPQAFHAKSQKFTGHLGQCGMYRNYSLNTAVDKNPVTSQLDGLF